jgi:transcriptional regulator with XRE-family HTH domain
VGNHNRSYGEDEGADEMNLSKQIKRLREEAGFSQEELSEKIYVSRQTISNWENERSYPDIHNLLLLSVLFDVTLDELVKGDVETMKNVIKKDEMNRYSYIMLGTIGGSSDFIRTCLEVIWEYRTFDPVRIVASWYVGGA